MPASLKDLRSRIKSVKSTQQITKAMKLVSAAKFGKAQNVVMESRFYASAISKLSSRLAKLSAGGCSNSLMNISSSKNALVLVISSERGLCGGYNSNVTKQALKVASELEVQGYKPFFLCIGKKTYQSLLRRRRLSEKASSEPAVVSEENYINNPVSLLGGEGLTYIAASFNKPTNNMAKNLSDAISALFSEAKIGKFIAVYNKFQSAMVQLPTASNIFPLQVQNSEPEAEPIFEPDLDDLLNSVLPRYIASVVFQILLEAVASEHGARMTAMDNATRNAKDMERKLQTTYQRARQASITKELIEIISGAEAL